MTRGGLPHSDISGSKLVCSSPGLFAACHVLHRLLAPRHSPYTLSSLTIRNSKLTLTNRLHINWSATVPCNTACPPSRLAATADECCGRKKLPCAEYSVVKDQACRASAGNLLTSGCASRRATRAALNNRVPTSVLRETRKPHSLTETFQRAPCLRLAQRRDRLLARSTNLSAAFELACQAVALCSSERRLVENTGLEPVTSWLQTRRSPS